MKKPEQADDGIPVSVHVGGIYLGRGSQRVRSIWKIANDGTVHWADDLDKWGSCTVAEFRAWASRER